VATYVDDIDPGSAEIVHPESPEGAIVPWPPQGLMSLVGAPTPENYLLVAEGWKATIDPFIPERARVLDVGCGSGRTARTLVDDPRIDEYLGLDVVDEAVRWCSQFVTPRSGGRFHFERVDAASAAYNPGGRLRPSEVRFPVADRSFDIAIAASLFTHLLEADAAHYLSELSRVLVPGGKAVVSILTETPPGRPWSGGEFRTDVYPSYFEALASRAALVVREELGEVCGEQVLVLESVRVSS